MVYLSIITVSYNNCKGLIITRDSILPLPDNCEWIIIDGDSDDGSKELLCLLPKQDNIKYISEKDYGIYDAMNKGILLSRGRYLNFMNAGDSYLRNNFIEITSNELNTADFIMFNCQTVTLDNQTGYTRSFPKSINELEKWACVQHQSTLIRKSVFKLIGLYSLEYKYLADYEHSVKAYISNNFTFLLCGEKKLALFQLDGVSTNSKTALKIAKEYKQIQLKYFGKYNYILYISNYIKYIIGFCPYKDNIINILKKIFFKKR